MRRDGVEALLVLPDSFSTFHRARISELAARHRMPAIYGHSQFVEVDGLMSYGPSFVDAYHRAASHVDKLLKGAMPAELPVQEPTKFELIINLKTSNALGFDVPQPLMSRADRVIK